MTGVCGPAPARPCPLPGHDLTGQTSRSGSPAGPSAALLTALARPDIQALAVAHAPQISGPARSRYRDRMPITLGPDAAAARQAASLFRELANPTRLAILLTLQTGEQRITDLAGQLGGSQANISAHLIRLRQAGLITSRPQGRAVYYRLTQPELGDLLQAAGRLRPTRLSLRSAPRDPPGRRWQDQRGWLRVVLLLSPSCRHSPAGLDRHPQPRRHHQCPQPRRHQDLPQPRPARPPRVTSTTRKSRSVERGDLVQGDAFGRDGRRDHPGGRYLEDPGPPATTDCCPHRSCTR
jgi:ArsR family transcriptional regulator, cadmium/lead-responsive transcriptional repressor